MTLDNAFPNVLTPVDSAMKTFYHHRLDLNDECYFLGQYAVGGGFDHCDNQLIRNFKKDMSHKGMRDWHYKAAAIRTIARALRAAIRPWGSNTIDMSTFVPIPPSKVRSDPGYDDRLTNMLRAVRNAPPLDVRDLVVQVESTDAAHVSLDRLDAEDLVDLYEINESLASPNPEHIVIVDDVITTGSHFRATKDILSRRFPNAAFVGIFIARSIHLNVEGDDFPEIEI